MSKSKIVSGKMFRITITGEVPPTLVGGRPEQTVATLLSCVSVTAGLVGVVHNIDCSLGDLQPAAPPPTH